MPQARLERTIVETEASEVRKPIPYGLMKLISFVILVATVTYVAWVYVHPAWATIAFVGPFVAVRSVHPQGWTDWIREFWFWNVMGAVECYSYNEDSGEIERHLEQYLYGTYRLHHRWRYSGSWGILIRRSGWSRRCWVTIGWDAVSGGFWSVGKPQVGGLSVAGRPFASPTTTIRLTQKDGTCLDLSMEQAFRALHTLTVFKEYGIHGTHPFSHLLPSSATTASSTNGTA